MAKTVFDDTPPLGTIVTADFLNAVNNHRHTGRNIDGDGALDYAAASGSDNDYVLTLSPALDAHIAGMVINFKANHTNSGAASININGLGAVDLKKNGDVDVGAGDITSGIIYQIAYDGTNYQIISSTPSQLYYAAASGSGNAYAAAFSPALTAHVIGLPLVFKANHTNTGASTLAVNALTAVALKRIDGSALLADDIPSGGMMLVAYDGTNYQVLNVANPNGACLLAEDGYQWTGKKLEQWGAYTTPLNSNAEITITFPVEFPNACFHVDVSMINGKDGSLDWTLLVKRNTISATGVTIRVVKNGLNPDIGGFYWRAIGY